MAQPQLWNNPCLLAEISWSVYFTSVRYGCQVRLRKLLHESDRFVFLEMYQMYSAQGDAALNGECFMSSTYISNVISLLLSVICSPQT